MHDVGVLFQLQTIFEHKHSNQVIVLTKDVQFHFHRYWFTDSIVCGALVDSRLVPLDALQR